MIEWIITQKDSVPTAQNCQLGPLEESQSGNLDVVQTAIQTAVTSQTCPEGVYNVNGSVFVAKAGVVTLFKAAEQGSVPDQSTPTVGP
ncbi:hypothetical protein EG832_04515 [bacterium]|nr:hypothetical protein [bacterium]